MEPKMNHRVLVRSSDIFVYIAAKLFHSVSGGTNVEPAFIDEEDRGIAIPQFAFTQVVSAEGSVLRSISGRILVKRGLVGHGGEMVDRTPEPGLNRWVAFDGLMTGKVGNWVVSLQNYTIGVNVRLGLRNGLGGFFCQDDYVFVFCDFSRIPERAPGQAGRIDEKGNRNGCDETRNKRDRKRFHNWTLLHSGLAHNRILALAARQMLSWIQDTILSQVGSDFWPYIFVKVDGKEECPN